jgi:uncharacterized protein (TIGR02145 family)
MSLCLWGCSDDDDAQPVVKPSTSGTLTDIDGNEYTWVRLGHLDWMASNLNSGEPWFNQTYLTPRGYTQEFDVDVETETAMLETYGNLYTYKQAVEQCPEGWRLPTDDDWKDLEMSLGMNPSEADKEGWRQGAGFLMAQTLDEGTGMHMVYGGQVSSFSSSQLKLFHRGDYGCYWSSTPGDYTAQATNYIRMICPLMDKVERCAAPSSMRYMSVRYCRDAAQ